MHFRVLRGAALTLVALIGAAGLVVTATMSTLVQLAATALIMGGTGMKALGDPHQWGAGTYVDQVNSTYLAGYHLDEDDLRWVSTPEQFWPATSLTDISFDTSVARGVLSLNNAVQTTPGEKVVVGYSQSANIATREKRNLAELRAQGATVPAPDELSFVFVANPNRPNGGILARFEGLYIPILGVSFDGATPDDEYRTIDVARQYDLIADFPKYPLNLLADLNALMGYFYLHPNYGSSVVNLNDPGTYDSYTSGNTTYYLVHTAQLPLLQPFRDIGVPEPVLDLVEPTLRVLIELAYDRTPANMGVPTRAGLIPHIDLDKLASDLRAAAREGVRNALADLGIDTTGAADRTTGDIAVLKPVPETLNDDTATPDDMQPARIRPHLPRTHSGSGNGILNNGPGSKTLEVTVDTETNAEIPAKSDAAPKPKSQPERIRESVRQALSPKKPSDAVKADSPDRAPRPVRSAHRISGSGSPRAESGAAGTKGSTAQDKPRRHQRAGNPDAA
ncbi:PE-PPE domain-containing protein [Mycolicibacterium fortuitum]|uniref:PE-PPE domain-containing protein n=2 Tax=Mycolicibacterium fortuitum TaxID=1766 RepID=A0AAE5AC71_MYCFO|nr:PE-PPE domain-containing protein [Mycolicibacterium fortuitum]MCV7138701.1 PE-PPE domain-containing protein [Mycolicibacterium fortuitum]MDV7189438.1 PE-PPE domain-containing protein [Mycolicibacterium fortuitum]MDV7202525.1 PE-PPE domain-containing protein [Mycolicibacterium fortuitum]MDV7229677.1 PE-PPE domain-containing protein [Mycolicibacterium fortuitum]MDV7256331.1 PE-PPE domain-containing protein [Mycolicibacterium fortuitum]